MRACKPRHKEPPARSLMWATAAQPGPRWLSGTQSRGRVLGNQLSWRWQEEERITTVRSGSHRGRDSGELRAGWVRGKGRVVPWCGGPHHCYGTAPLLLREPTLYYARHRQAIHTPAQLLLCSTAIREGVLPALSNVCKSSKIAGQPKFGGSSFRRRPIKGVADLGSALLSSSSDEADSSGTELLAFSGVSVLVHARLCLLGRMLGSCIQQFEHNPECSLACSACHGLASVPQEQCHDVTMLDKQQPGEGRGNVMWAILYVLPAFEGNVFRQYFVYDSREICTWLIFDGKMAV